ncbi:hypothetical protein DL770_006511 [Monosporascus sp. CRB-9-2]|nr:hypothetical protein DL770_006511 [Monosporascus sp. CRB-9-2]
MSFSLSFKKMRSEEAPLASYIERFSTRLIRSWAMLSLTWKEFKLKHDNRGDRTNPNHMIELQNLAILNHLKHPNIVELLGSYTYDGKHNLLFPLADTGNLAKLLAVEHVHDFSERKIDLELIGCHHDLRPRNILISGINFILADFGLSTFKPRTQNSATPFKNVCDDYLAPECVDLHNGLEGGIVVRKVLNVEPSERPKANEVTARLRLVALHAQLRDLAGLSRLNDGLRSMLNPEQEERCREYFHVVVMEEASDLSEPPVGTDRGVSLDKEIRMRVNIKHVNTLLAQDAVSESRTMHVEPSAVDIRSVFGQHHVALLSNHQPPQPVLVEWRRYGRHGADEDVIGKLYRRTAMIAEVLSHEKPEEFRTLRCNGFFHSPDRAAFGLVFEIPRTPLASNSLKPMNLQQLIAATSEKYSLWPDLDDRFKLASMLAASVFELHSVGWLHKGLTSSNIAFFPKRSYGQSQLIHEPFIIGFNHSRPNDPFTFTSGLDDSNSNHYQHPTYIKGGHGYRPEFDYYSLGIILLEIGFWQPFSKIAKRCSGSYEERREQLLTDRVPQLKQHMGRDYFEAVRCCIDGDFGRTHSVPQEQANSVDLLLQFGERVVARLRRYIV